MERADRWPILGASGSGTRVGLTLTAVTACASGRPLLTFTRHIHGNPAPLLASQDL